MANVNIRTGRRGVAASRRTSLHRGHKDSLKQGKLPGGKLCSKSIMNEITNDVEVLKQKKEHLTFHCECTKARWVKLEVFWPHCSSPGIYMQAGSSALLSSPPVLARGHGPITIVGCLHASKPRSRVQPPPLFAPPLLVIDTSPSPNLTVTQHFSVRITREGPAAAVDTASPSSPFALGLAFQARSDPRCRDSSLTPSDLLPSPRPPRPRFSSQPLPISTPISTSK